MNITGERKYESVCTTIHLSIYEYGFGSGGVCNFVKKQNIKGSARIFQGLPCKQGHSGQGEETF